MPLNMASLLQAVGHTRNQRRQQRPPATLHPSHATSLSFTLKVIEPSRESHVLPFLPV